MIRALAATVLLLCGAARAQIGPGERADPAGEAASIGVAAERFVDDPPAGAAPSIGESSEPFDDDAPAGEAPSIGGAARRFAPDDAGEPLGAASPAD